MRRRHVLRTPGAAWLGAAMGAWMTAAACRSVQEPRPAPVAREQAAAPTGLVAEPSVRVGVLVDVPRVSIGADSGVIVYAGRDGHRSVVARATFVAGEGAPGGPRYRVQVASLAAETGAENVATRVQETAGLPPTVHWNPRTETHQVRVGEFGTRDEALRLATRLSRSGLPGAFVVEDGGPGEPGKLRLVETGEELTSATIVPQGPDDLLAADAASYRGVLEVRSTPAGLTVVNLVHIEDYLRGVVPNELSPAAFPEMEALKAQAVAARSYVLNHLGEFAARGYDICATPACQVYRGQSSEHPVTDRAVAETRGLVASWRGRPINAYYTSTCGGHTEDGENVFDGPPIAYLKGVACAPERSAWSTVHSAAAPREIAKEPGLGRDLSLLRALGVVDPTLGGEARKLGGIPTDAEVRTWVARLRGALRRDGCPAPVSGALARRGTFAQYLVAALCWEERGRRLLAPPDPEYLLAVEDRASLAGEDERLAAAVLVQEGVLSPFPDNTLRPGAALTRAEAVTLLARATEKADPPGLIAAEFAGVAAGQVTVLRGEVPESWPLDPEVRLFRNLEGVRAAASELTLAVGDRVNLVLEDGRVAFLEAEQTRKGAAADRSSRYYRWEARLTPADLGRMVARYGEVGAVRDMVPRRIGVSGRVVELAVQGSEGEVVLRGLRIRTALGLRESLFVIERERDPQGAVQRFLITGKGWGHGVGLCQVGAFGLAQSGSTFEQILQHYYRGVRVERTY